MFHEFMIYTLGVMTPGLILEFIEFYRAMRKPTTEHDTAYRHELLGDK